MITTESEISSSATRIRSDSLPLKSSRKYCAFRSNSLAQRKALCQGTRRRSNSISIGSPYAVLPQVFASRVLLQTNILLLGSITVILFYYIIVYFLVSGDATIYMANARIVNALVTNIFVQGVLSALNSRTVDNSDMIEFQEVWFAYVRPCWRRSGGRSRARSQNTGSVSRGLTAECHT